MPPPAVFPTAKRSIGLVVVRARYTYPNVIAVSRRGRRLLRITCAKFALRISLFFLSCFFRPRLSLSLSLFLFFPFFANFRVFVEKERLANFVRMARPCNEKPLHEIIPDDAFTRASHAKRPVSQGYTLAPGDELQLDLAKFYHGLSAFWKYQRVFSAIVSINKPRAVTTSGQ